jgi:hypothetical protein
VLVMGGNDPVFWAHMLPPMLIGLALRILRAFWPVPLSIAIMLALWLAL